MNIVTKRILAAVVAAFCILAGCASRPSEPSQAAGVPARETHIASESGGENQPELTSLEQVVGAVQGVIQGADDLESNYEPTRDEYAQMQGAVAALGVPVSTYDRDMANYQLVVDFCEAVKSGKDAEVTIYSLYSFAIYAEHFEQKDGRLTCATTVSYYGKWKPEDGLPWKLDNFELLENGWLSWRSEGASEYQGVRVLPLGEELWELYRTYVNGFYFSVNGVLSKNWNQNDTSGLVWEFVFESMLARDGGSLYDYPAPDGEDRPFVIPAADVEDSLTRHFPVTSQQLHQLPAYDAASNTYRFMGFRGGGYSPRVEVTGKTNNPDGSFTLEVQFPSPEFKKAGTHSYLTILPDGQGGYRYIGNKTR